MPRRNSPNKPYISALEQLHQLWAAEDFDGALKLAASWPKLGKQKNAIQQGWAAVSNRSFYEQIGKDPDELRNLAIIAMVQRYGLEDQEN